MELTTKLADMNERGNLGQGVYSLAELRLFVAFYAGHEAGNRVLTWLNRALHPVGHRSHQPDYSFFDLVSLLVVSELISHGVPMRKIRESEGYLRQQTGVDRPFTHRKLKTDGYHVFIDGAHPSQLEITGRAGGQQVQATIISQFVKEIQYSGDWAARWTPAPFVEIDPERQFGEPTVAGTRVLTRDVFETAQEASIAETAECFGISNGAVRGALDFEEKLATAA